MDERNAVGGIEEALVEFAVIEAEVKVLASWLRGH